MGTFTFHSFMIFVLTVYTVFIVLVMATPIALILSPRSLDSLILKLYFELRNEKGSTKLVKETTIGELRFNNRPIYHVSDLKSELTDIQGIDTAFYDRRNGLILICFKSKEHRVLSEL